MLRSPQLVRRYSNDHSSPTASVLICSPDLVLNVARVLAIGRQGPALKSTRGAWASWSSCYGAEVYIHLNLRCAVKGSLVEVGRRVPDQPLDLPLFFSEPIGTSVAGAALSCGTIENRSLSMTSLCPARSANIEPVELDDDDDGGDPTYTWLSTVGDRAFPVAGSRLWNSHLSINYTHCFPEPPQNISFP